mmetsp:Transcript_44083/g.95882  ORF Transcript_44083/g.95882 Transcript_44083/m.95882 type:complete len:235 (+) Transcript_44083:950-1654(+)
MERKVEGLEAVAALGDLVWQLARSPRRPGPEAGGEHGDLHLDPAGCGGSRAASSPGELLHEIFGSPHVLEHALQFRGVLVTALALQLGDHAFLRLVAHTATCEKAAGKMLLVKVFEDVLVLQEAEHCDHLFEAGVDLDIAGQALQALSEQVINEEGQVLGCPCIFIQKGLKRLFHRQLEVFALLEALLDELIILVLKVQNFGDERDWILDFLRVVEDVCTRRADAVDHDSLNLL